MRYYEIEPASVYRQVASEHKTQWSDVFEEEQTGGFAAFPNRAFLERVLPAFGNPVDVLEYGCGTGPAACFLAERGLHVDAVDLIPEAIDLARKFAAERGLRINFAVQDVCRWPDNIDKHYDLVIDSYCLQNIVLDDHRAALFSGVQARLKPAGHYLISTALYDPDRTYDDEFRYDPAAGICYRDDLPYRRHLTPTALHTELTKAGFKVRSHTGNDLVCEQRANLGAGH
jgi:SAM-dependent methyltransferase